MEILINDFIQYSDAVATLKSPALAETTSLQTAVITFNKERTFNSIGIGNTTALTVEVNGQTINLDSEDKNGLYALISPITSTTCTITFTEVVTVGRIAIGFARKLGAAPAREPGFTSTIKSRLTLSGQVIPGLGGVPGRTLSVDFRYKFDRGIFTDIQAAYPTQIARMFPLFISLPTATEQNRFPWKRFYGFTDPNWLFQSSVNKMLYSKKLKFTEAF